MFQWLKNLFEGVCNFTQKISEPDNFQFVKSLCDKAEPHIHSSWSLGYLYEFEMGFIDGIKITVEYNIIRDEWDMEIWSGRSETFLFYHDCLDPTPWQTIDYLVERYNLLPILDKAIALKAQQEAESKKREQEVLKKYL